MKLLRLRPPSLEFKKTYANALTGVVVCVQVSVAPSRTSSRMQQYNDEPADDDEARNSGDGALNGVGAGGEADEDAEQATPRTEKQPNPASVQVVAGVNGGGLVHATETDEDDYEEPARSNHIAANNGGVGGYWRQVASRPASPCQATMADNASDASSMLPPARPKSRVELTTSRYSNLSYWRARRVIFYKNGDPFFPGIEFRFKPGRDIGSLESLLDKLSLRMDLPRGARYIFSMDGDRKFRLDELEDGASYVVSSYKTFKVSRYLGR